MRIIISDSAAKYLSEDERKYLLLLEFYEDFVSEIENIKKLFEAKKIYLFPDTLIPILQKYHVPIKFIYPLEEYIQFGEIFSVHQPIQIFGVRHQLNRSFLYYDKLFPPPTKLQNKLFWDSWYEGNKHAFADKGITPALPIIQLNKRLSKNELIKYIKNRWDEIEEAIEDYEKSDPYPEKNIDISIRELEKYMIIYRYRLDKLPYKQIYKKLEEAHKITFAGGEEEVKRICFKMRSLLKRLGFTK